MDSDLDPSDLSVKARSRSTPAFPPLPAAHRRRAKNFLPASSSSSSSFAFVQSFSASGARALAFPLVAVRRRPTQGHTAARTSTAPARAPPPPPAAAAAACAWSHPSLLCFPSDPSPSTLPPRADRLTAARPFFLCQTVYHPPPPRPRFRLRLWDNLDTRACAALGVSLLAKTNKTSRTPRTTRGRRMTRRSATRNHVELRD